MSRRWGRHYPNAFAAFVCALACVLGAAIAHTLLRGGLTARTGGAAIDDFLRGAPVDPASAAPATCRAIATE